MQLVMVRWCGVLGAEQCWAVCWARLPPIEDFGSITSHAQSTAATYFTSAVKSVVVHLVMVCGVLLLQSFGAEQIGHTRWPTNIFAHACVEVKPISIPFRASLPATKQAEVLGMNNTGWSYGSPMKTLAVLHHMHRAQLPHISPVR